MQLTPKKEKKYIREALNDSHLRASVDKATQTSLQKRQDKVDQIPYWEELRYRANAIKRDVTENLDRYLEQFEQNCAQNGMTVHWAADAAEARTIIRNLAQKNGVQTIVKSKSLTTEEINLNKALEKAGPEVLETDLGEFIVQLLDQIPSHLTAPALHLNRKDIGRIFHKKLGVAYTKDPDELLAIARKTLRQKFMQADMGISGVNFAVADTGCLCIVENEANARLTVSLPKIHVAVMGIEKLVPGFAELATFLKLLPASATGQLASVYVNLIGGPSPQKNEGVEEVHVVLLDNGRSKILADPQLRETLFCIRCAACLNVCPIYQQVGGHAYGWVYMGPIGITLIPQFLGESEGRYAPFMSSLCGACGEICPVKIQLPHHMLKLRNRVVESGRSMFLEKPAIKMWAFLAKRPARYRFATWFPAQIQKLLPKNTAFPAPGYMKKRALGRFDPRGFRNRYKKWLKETEKT